MLPELQYEIGEIARMQQSDRTWRVSAENKVIGMTDGIDAVKQAVHFILGTERFRYDIYTWNYGIELQDLIGKDRDYVCAELKRRITEALLQDERVESVDAFCFQYDRHAVTVQFTVRTVYGDYREESEVKL